MFYMPYEYRKPCLIAKTVAINFFVEGAIIRNCVMSMIIIDLIISISLL